MGSALPPFAIRHLHDEKPYSVLQVSEQQYQTTIQSHPDATLSYLDEDDGEEVTVGSSLELKQRLNDPPAPTASLVHCYNTNKHEFEDRFIHLFDIKRTNTSRAVWKIHEACYTRQQIQDETAREDKVENDSVSSIDINATNANIENIITDATNQDSALQTVRNVANEVRPVVNLADAIPDLVDNLAILLQSTSDTLRRAAEKTRESNKSPVEDVLSGMSNIVAEIGSFGLSLLDSLSDKNPSNVHMVATHDEQGPDVLEKSSIVEEETNSVEARITAIPMTGSVEGPEEVTAKKNISLECDSCKFCSTCRLQCRKSPEESSCHNCATLDQPCSLSATKAHISTPAALDKDYAWIGDSIASKVDSILDQDTEDADFSRRYPPLISLRRANTIAALHDRFAESGSDILGDQSLKRHNSWTRRYPQRPLPHILDAEAHRRRDFARNCYPNQKYVPGLGSHETKSARAKDFVSAKPSWVDIETQKRYNIRCQPSTSTTLGANATLDHEDVAAIVTATNSDTTTGNAVIDSVGTAPISPLDTSNKSLPGAWPEIPEARNAVGAPPGESSGAFFHRMMRDNPSRRQKHTLDADERLTRHRSFSRQRPNKNPFRDLNRSHTLSSSTNPASRLNGPFDPLYPVTISSTIASTNKAESSTLQGDLSKLGTCQPAPKFTERAMAFPRPFSPVWEEHLNQNALLDRNGESTSMYSPPPRHMRSVPNFTSYTKTNSVADASAPVSAVSTNSTTSPIQGKMSLVNGIPVPTSNAQSPSSAPYQVMFHRKANAKSASQMSASSSSRTSIPAVSNAVANLQAYRNSIPSNSPESTYPANEGVRKCLIALQEMGYGLHDANLRSRLHVYASAAGGDVMDAVDMIEEDKKASVPVMADREHPDRMRKDTGYSRKKMFARGDDDMDVDEL